MFPNVTEEAITAVKHLTYDERNQLAKMINDTDPQSIFSPNPKNKDEIICPLCGNGSGKSHTGVKPTHKENGWLYGCRKPNCNFNGLITTIIAKEMNLDKRNDFCEILAIGAAFCNIPVSPSVIEYVSRRRNSLTQKQAITDKPKTRKDYSQKFYPLAKKNLPDFIKKNGGRWRGFTLQELQAAEIGFSTNNDGRRIIIPYDKFHCLARAVDKDTPSPKKHYGSKALAVYNFDAIDTNHVIFVFEGEIDSLSVKVASGGLIHAVALGGVGDYQGLIDRLAQIYASAKTKPRFCVVADNDDKNGQNVGQENAPAIVDALMKAGYPAVNHVLSERKNFDANDWFIEDRAGLFARMQELEKISEPELEVAAQEIQSHSKNKVASTMKDEVSDVPQSSATPNIAMTTENTTQKNCPDCPIKLELPLSVEFYPDKIIITDQKSKAHKAADTAIIPTRILRNPDTGFTEYEIAIRSVGEHKWRYVTVDGKTLCDARAVMELANYGAAITSTSAKYLNEYFSQILSHNNGNLPLCRLYSQPGWRDDFSQFIYPSNKTEDYAVQTNGFDYGRAYSSKGDLSAWQKMFKVVISTSTVARLIIGASLAAPLIRVLGLPPAIINLASPSGCGKTAIQKFAASIYGSPAELLGKFNGTMNALEQLAVVNNDFPTFIDELQTLKKLSRESILDNFIYNRESGKTRARLNKNSQLMERKSFAGITITSGEQTLTTAQSGEGAIKRCLDITDPVIFDNDFAVEVHEFCRQHYGLIGRRWIEYICENRSKIAAFYGKAKQFLQQQYKAAFPAHIAVVTLCYVAGMYFEKMIGVGDIDSAFMKFHGDDVERIFTDRIYKLPEKIASANSARALDAVAEFFYVNNSKFLPLTRGYQYSDPDKNFEVYGYYYRDTNEEGDEEFIAFHPGVLKKALQDFPNAEACIRGFSENKILDEQKKQNPSRRYQRALKINGQTRWLYVFKWQELFASAEQAAEEETFAI